MRRDSVCWCWCWFSGGAGGGGVGVFLVGYPISFSLGCIRFHLGCIAVLHPENAPECKVRLSDLFLYYRHHTGRDICLHY